MNAPARVVDPITIMNARILWRNFKGEAGMYNPVGNRNFDIVLDDAQAAEFKRIGWNVKTKDGREEGDPPRHTLNIKVKFETKGRPPKLAIVTRRGRTDLGDEEMCKKNPTMGPVEILDWTEFKNVDLIIRPYNWEFNGKNGVTAYLKTFFAHIVEDELEEKYAEVPYAEEAPTADLPQAPDDISELDEMAPWDKADA